jgi:hypothetical protein
MRLAVVLLAMIVLIAAPMAALAAEPFSATLTTGAEVPPVSGEGSGLATVTISDDATEIAYEVSYEGLTGAVVAAHIHYGAADVAGGVILPLAHGASPFSGTLTEADFTPLDGGPQTFAEALAAIRAGQTYINLHTQANPGGEIRGQVMALPDTATGDTPAAPVPWTIVLAILGLAVLLAATRRFAARIA